MCGGNHTEDMIAKLSAACYAVRSAVHNSNSNSNRPKSIYYAYFYSIIKHGIIFWGNFQQREDFYFTKWSELWLVQNPEPLVLYKSIEATRDSTCSMPVHTH